MIKMPSTDNQPPINHEQVSERATQTNRNKRLLIVIAISTIVILAWVTIVMFVIKPAVEKNQARAGLPTTRVKSPATQLYTLESSKGFKLRYNAEQLQVNGRTINSSSTDQVIRGQEYTDPKELAIPRPYSIVTFEIPDNGTNDAYLSMPRMAIIASHRIESLKDFATLPEHKNLSELDLFTEYSTQETLTANDDMVVLGRPQPLTINGIAYRKVVFVQKDSFEALPPSDEYYFTVQHNQGFICKITNIDGDNKNEVSKFEAILKTLSFPKPSNK